MHSFQSTDRGVEGGGTGDDLYLNKPLDLVPLASILMLSFVKPMTSDVTVPFISAFVVSQPTPYVC